MQLRRLLDASNVRIYWWNSRTRDWVDVGGTTFDPVTRKVSVPLGVDVMSNPDFGWKLVSMRGERAVAPVNSAPGALAIGLIATGCAALSCCFVYWLVVRRARPSENKPSIFDGIVVSRPTGSNRA